MDRGTVACPCLQRQVWKQEPCSTPKALGAVYSRRPRAGRCIAAVPSRVSGFIYSKIYAHVDDNDKNSI